MRKLFLILGAVGVLALHAGSAFSQDADDPDADTGPWSGKLLAGYLATSGNTESTSANFEAALGWDGERWHHLLSGRAIGQSEDKTTTAESYKASYDARFDLTERTYLFGLADYNKNRFSSYEYQIFEFAGIGRRFIDSDRQKFDAQAGVGFGQSELLTGDNQDEFNWRASAEYLLNITDHSSFRQTLAVNSGKSNTFIESVSELRANIYGSLSAVLSYTIQRNSDVLPGTEKKDTFTAINLEYAFGQ